MANGREGSSPSPGTSSFITIIRSPTLVFFNGSINSGKTTTSRLVADRLNAEFINVDDLNDSIPNFNLETDIPKSFQLATSVINAHLAKGKDVVANYVIRNEDWKSLLESLKAEEIHFITLAPRLEIAQSQRGDRKLSKWEIQRIKYHYDTGIPTPRHGHVIDNSELSIEETVDEALRIIGHL